MSIIELPELERGYRLVVNEPVNDLPDVIPVTFDDEEEGTITVRYLNMEMLPEELRLKCEEYYYSICS